MCVEKKELKTAKPNGHEIQDMLSATILYKASYIYIYRKTQTVLTFLSHLIPLFTIFLFLCGSSL